MVCRDYVVHKNVINGKESRAQFNLLVVNGLYYYDIQTEVRQTDRQTDRSYNLLIKLRSLTFFNRIHIYLHEGNATALEMLCYVLCQFVLAYPSSDNSLLKIINTLTCPKVIRSAYCTTLEVLIFYTNLY